MKNAKTWRDATGWELEIEGFPGSKLSDPSVTVAVGPTAADELSFAIDSLQTLNEVIAYLESLRACFLAVSPSRPTVVCLCGSTRFSEAFRQANLNETLAGRIVLSVGCDTKSDEALHLGPGVKALLDELHKRKIDLADEILVLNVDDYIGESTMSEIEYAEAHGKRIRFLEPREDGER
jgi:hypothetical protein